MCRQCGRVICVCPVASPRTVDEVRRIVRDIQGMSPTDARETDRALEQLENAVRAKRAEGKGAK